MQNERGERSHSVLSKESMLEEVDGVGKVINHYDMVLLRKMVPMG